MLTDQRHHLGENSPNLKNRKSKRNVLTEQIRLQKLAKSSSTSRKSMRVELKHLSVPIWPTGSDFGARQIKLFENYHS